MQHNIYEIQNETKYLSAEKLIKHMIGKFGTRISLSSSMSAEDQVLTDMLCKLTQRPQIFTIDTGRLPEETYELIEETRKHYGIEIRILFPDYRQVEEMVNENGPNLFYGSIEARKLCCKIRKVEPLKKELAKLDAWICGLRIEQSQTRTDLLPLQYDETFGLIKVSPLVYWTTEQVWDYIHKNKIPYNRLHDRGYPSIGCAPCTRAVKPGQDIRAGRWWWEKNQHKECGLHLNGNKTKTKGAV